MLQQLGITSFKAKHLASTSVRNCSKSSSFPLQELLSSSRCMVNDTLPLKLLRKKLTVIPTDFLEFFSGRAVCPRTLIGGIHFHHDFANFFISTSAFGNVVEKESSVFVTKHQMMFCCQEMRRLCLTSFCLVPVLKVSATVGLEIIFLIISTWITCRDVLNFSLFKNSFRGKSTEYGLTHKQAFRHLFKESRELCWCGNESSNQ